MSLTTLNFYFFLFFFLFFYFLVNFNNNIQSLIFSEFIWITLYSTSLIISFVFNDINLMSLTIFFLIFSASEISIGLTIFYLQNFFINNNTYLYNNNNFNKNLNLNKIINLKKFKII